MTGAEDDGRRQEDRDREDEQPGEDLVERPESDPPAEGDPAPEVLPEPREPAPSELPDRLLSVGNAERLDDHRIEQRFSGRTAEFIRTSDAGYAARVSGAGISRGSIRLDLLTELLPALARTPRWVVSSLFGKGRDPGVSAAYAGASLVVHFTLPEDEEVRSFGTERVFPTAEAARYVGGLLGATRSEPELLEGVSYLGRNAVRRFAGALDLLADNGLSIDWLTRDGYAVATPIDYVRQGREILEQAPAVRTRHVSLTGWLFDANSKTRRFSFELLDGYGFTGRYRPEAIPSLDRAWDHQVIADFEVVEPEIPSLPRAPKPQYTLLRVTHITPRRPSTDP